MCIRDRTYLVRAGDLMHLEPGDTHRVENKSASIVQMVIALAPYQEEDKIPVEE